MRLWGADNTIILPGDGSMPPFKTWFPPLGGFRFGLFSVPPLSTKGPENIDMKAAIAEVEEKLPGMMKHMEPDSPGMHTSDTVDFEYVISGEVWLELDDGKEVHLKAGDTVIQNGTRHAWRNKGSEPCQMVTILIGANRNYVDLPAKKPPIAKDLSQMQAGEISWDTAMEYLGKQATVCGEIIEVMTPFPGLSVLGMGKGVMEAGSVAIDIRESDKAKFPEDLYVGKTICVKGTVVTNPLGKAKLDATDASQIVVK